MAKFKEFLIKLWQGHLHEWTRWKYTEGSHTVYKICMVCGKEKKKVTAHLWSIWKMDYPSTYQVRDCKVCGKIEKKDTI